MVERSVTRAAERLGRTQSAISHSLSRLRSQFGDPLLVKGGVRMQPTAFALDLIEQARPMLSGIQRALSPTQVFDPADSQRVFRLAVPDFALALFAELLARVRKEAPLVSVEWTTPRAPTLLDVAEGQVDLAIVPSELQWPQSVAGEAIGALGWRCFGRRDHPAFSEWGPANWARWAASCGADRRQCEKPGQRCRRRRRPDADDCRMGAAFSCDRADPGPVRSVGDAAIGGYGGRDRRLRSCEHGGSVCNCAAAACDGVVQRPQPRSRHDLVARPAPSDRQTHFRRLKAQDTCVLISSTSSFLQNGSRCARRARATPRRCWSWKVARCVTSSFPSCRNG
ncbi:LysR family transcriptional regulator [Bradyrhizobium japonicum]|uniref:LysR family transcriptional regulator n=1 Tax=Bradyrhizobium japonicum TaxID=375 RepID=UPI0033926E04